MSKIIFIPFSLALSFLPLYVTYVPGVTGIRTSENTMHSILLSLDILNKTTTSIMRSQNCHLLIVDDDEDDRFILDLSFRQIQWGGHIMMLGSGDEMFRHLDSLSNPASYPSLILLDYNMPRMGAEEIINRLKRHEHYNSIKVAVYSTDMTEALRMRLQSLGAVGCYSKGISVAAAMQLAGNLKEEAQKQQPFP